MLADFVADKGVFLMYPSRRDVWRRGALPMRETAVALANLLSKYQTVYFGTDREIGEPLDPRVRAVEMRYDDVWARDTGLIPLADGSYTAFHFNAWGGDEGLYDDYSRDSTVPTQMSALLGAPFRQSELTLEGGNLTTDSQGTLIAIKATVFNKNRNPLLTLPQIENRLRSDLNVKKIIWLDEGLAYDETGGHVDNICAFVAPHTVFLAWTDDKHSPQYGIVRAAYDRLSSERDAQGEKIEIIKIPLPSVFYRSEEDCEGIELSEQSKNRLENEPIQPSYINFIFARGCVVVPTFFDENDGKVLQIFKDFFKDREVLPFPAREIVLGGGGLHCITKNI